MTSHALMFHHFFNSDIHPRGQGAINDEEFENILNFVGIENILCAEDFMQRTLEGTLLPNHRCITLDDALQCQYDIAYPVLKKLDLTAFWFVYSSVLQGNIENLEVHRYFRTVVYSQIDDFYRDFFELIESHYPHARQKTQESFDPTEYLAEWDFYSDNDRRFRFIRDVALGPAQYTESMAKLMELRDFDVQTAAQSLWMDDTNIQQLHQDGHMIGLHSHTHPTCLANLNAAEQRIEYQQNYDHIESIVGEPPRTMAHPCNSYNQTTLDILKELGVVLGFRSNMKEIEPRSSLEMRREDHISILKQL